MKTKIVITYSVKDYLLAFTAAETLLRKTEIRGESLILYQSRNAPDPPKHLTDRYKIQRVQCSTDRNRYPEGPNHMFAKLMELFYLGKLGCDRLILTEPDAYPTCYNWASLLIQEHEAGGSLSVGRL